MINIPNALGILILLIHVTRGSNIKNRKPEIKIGKNNVDAKMKTGSNTNDI